jgi:hypothetical protein
MCMTSCRGSGGGVCDIMQKMEGRWDVLHGIMQKMEMSGDVWHDIMLTIYVREDQASCRS